MVTKYERLKRQRQTNGTPRRQHGPRTYLFCLDEQDRRKGGPLRSIGVFLLVAVVLIFVTGCCGTVPLPHRPPASLMKPAPTQYLLEPEQQRTTARKPSPA